MQAEKYKRVISIMYQKTFSLLSANNAKIILRMLIKKKNMARCNYIDDCGSVENL